MGCRSYSLNVAPSTSNSSALVAAGYSRQAGGKASSPAEWDLVCTGGGQRHFDGCRKSAITGGPDNSAVSFMYNAPPGLAESENRKKMAQLEKDKTPAERDVDRFGTLLANAPREGSYTTAPRLRFSVLQHCAQSL